MCTTPVAVVKNAARGQEGALAGKGEGTRMEEDESRPKPAAGTGRDLRALGVAELESYIAELRAEIARVEVALAERRDVRSAAEALFKPQAR